MTQDLLITLCFVKYICTLTCLIATSATLAASLATNAAMSFFSLGSGRLRVLGNSNRCSIPEASPIANTFKHSHTNDEQTRTNETILWSQAVHGDQQQAACHEMNATQTVASELRPITTHTGHRNSRQGWRMPQKETSSQSWRYMQTPKPWGTCNPAAAAALPAAAPLVC